MCTTKVHLHLWNYSRCLHPFVRSQTKYPSLTSSCATAALLMLPPGLGTPPRLEAEWTARKSREGAGLEGRIRDDDAAEAEVLDKPGCPQGSMTVLMTEEETICPQQGNHSNLNDIYIMSRVYFRKFWNLPSSCLWTLMSSFRIDVISWNTDVHSCSDNTVWHTLTVFVWATHLIEGFDDRKVIFRINLGFNLFPDIHPVLE